ncbi:MAG: hypothetical protein ACRENB_06100 [Gemmatimonadales bacterium]
MRATVFAAMCLLAACGGGGGASSAGPGPAPQASAGTAAQTFLRAAADSNLTRMAELWGTANGSAARTNSPADYTRRIVVMQTYLRADSSRILSEVPMPGDDTRRVVTVSLWRSGCMKQLPFTMVRARDGGWLVNEFNLTLLGNPARPCEPTEPPRG